MKNFLGAFFGSCLGVLLTMGLLVLIMVFALQGLENTLSGKSEEDDDEEIRKESVLKLELDGELTERETDQDPFEGLQLPFGGKDKTLGLNKLRKCLENAADFEKIKGVVVHVKNFGGGMASMQELRQMILDFRKKTNDKKFIWAYSESYSQGGYYVASACQRVFLHPCGDIRWQGLSAQIMFYAGMLKKLGVEVQVFRHGKFKSAVEPFILEKMSDENRKQYESFLNSIWQNIIEEISNSRNITNDSLQRMANHLRVKNPDDALKCGLIDQLYYWDEVEKQIRSELKLKNEKEKINFVSRRRVAELPNPSKKIVSDKVAVIYALGGIESGQGDNETIGSEGLCKAIRKASENEKVKAIVLRVNSPGGSALASDVIWRELVLAGKKKPLVVSMGDYAASGGYYISAPGQKIFARKNTITGSIGVFGMIPNVSGLLKDKIGIYTDTVNTNQYSDLGGIYRKYSDKEKEFIQSSVESVYDTFITRVSDGRKISKSVVDSIGQGRVWSGAEAKNIGLIDEFGGLYDAVAEAAKMAGLKEYNWVEYPEVSNPITEFLSKNRTQDEAEWLAKAVRQTEFRHTLASLRIMLHRENHPVFAWWPVIVRWQ